MPFGVRVSIQPLVKRARRILEHPDAPELILDATDPRCGKLPTWTPWDPAPQLVVDATDPRNGMPSA